MTEINKIEPLTGRNYRSWKYNIKLVLMERGLWKIADGTERKPETTDEKVKKAWDLRSDKAYSLIALSVAKEIQVHLTATTDAHEAWNILKEHFEVVSITQIVRLTKRFYHATMEEGGDLMKFITKMTAMAEELRELKEDIPSKKFAVVMLGALPDSYDNFLTSLNARSADTLTWESIKSQLIDEFLKRQDRSAEKHEEERHKFLDEALITTQSRGSYYPGRGSNYSYRGGGRGGSKVGRNSRGGFNQYAGGARNHPYNSNPVTHSSSFRGQFQSVSGRQFHGNCFFCGEHGHRANDCPKKQNEESLYVAHRDNIGKSSGQAVEEQSSSSVGEKYVFFHEDDVALSTECTDIEAGNNGNDDSLNDIEQVVFEGGISHSVDSDFHEDDVALSIEYQDDQKAVSTRNSDWYIDSAATRHMTYDQSIIMDLHLYDIDKQPDVYLGDNSKVSATGEGKVRLATNGPNGVYLRLESVAYVPQLSKNLLSVAAMAKKGAEICFDSEKCVVRKDEKSYTIGHCVNGKLYRVGIPDSAYFTSSGFSAGAVSKEVWHLRPKLPKC